MVDYCKGVGDDVTSDARAPPFLSLPKEISLQIKIIRNRVLSIVERCFPFDPLMEKSLLLSVLQREFVQNTVIKSSF